MSSILTNASAMTALQTLKITNRELANTQGRISTGLKIGTAKDGASYWAVSTVMRSDVNAFKSINQNLTLAEKSVGVASSGADQISKLIGKIKTEVTSAQEGSIDKAKLQANIDSYIAQIGEITNSASFNGVNLLKSDDQVKVVSSLARSGSSVDASYIQFNAIDLRTSGSGALTGIADLNVLDRGDTLLKNATDGLRKTSFAVGAVSANGEMTINYRDADGTAKAISVTSTSAILANGGAAATSVLNNNADFNAMFTAVANGNNVEIIAKNREYSGLKVDSVSFDGAAAVLSTAQVRTGQLEFQASTPMQIGESMVVNYAIDGTEKHVTLQVAANTANGTVLGTDADGFEILAVNADTVSDAGVTANNLRDSVYNALLAHADFDNAAGDSVITISNATAGVVSFSTTTTVANGATDDIWSVTPPQTDYGSLLTKIETAMDAAIDAAAAFGSVQARLEIQNDFVSSLVDNLTQGIGALVDANMNEESAKLQALQVQQQLGIQSLSMANQAPQALLSLFR